MQGPIGAAVYQAIGTGVRRAGAFFWIGDLARPDLLIAAIAAVLAGAAASNLVSAGQSLWLKVGQDTGTRKQ